MTRGFPGWEEEEEEELYCLLLQRGAREEGGKRWALRLGSRRIVALETPRGERKASIWVVEAILGYIMP